jgi:hypothetical protein
MPQITTELQALAAEQELRFEMGKARALAYEVAAEPCDPSALAAALSRRLEAVGTQQVCPFRQPRREPPPSCVA